MMEKTGLSASARPNRSTDQIEEKSAALLVRFIHSPDAATRAEVARWIEQCPRQAVAFASVQSAWEQAERLKAGGGDQCDWTAPEEQPVARLWASRRNFLIGGSAIAASLAAGVVLLGRRPADFITGVGEVRDARLEDGSVLHLNTDSHVTVDYMPQRRLLTLWRGEASFDVAHDTRRPFDVLARGTMVRALGTSFNVRLRDTQVELTVMKGVVGVRNAAEAMRKVPAGDGATIATGMVKVASLDPRAINSRTAWHSLMIEFDGDTVERAVAELNRYRIVPVVIGDARVAALRIGGRFRIDQPEQFIVALRETLPVRTVAGEDGSMILLYRDDPVDNSI